MLMKKILLSLVALCGISVASAQVFTNVSTAEDAVILHITKDAATLQTEYAEGKGGAWGIGMKWPAGYDMYTDSKLSVTPYTPFAFALDDWGKQTLVEAITGNKMYLNCGCNIKASESPFSESTIVTSSQAIYDGDSKANGILKVTVKADGYLGFKAFEGGNTRCMGIYTLATADEIKAGNAIINAADDNESLSDAEYDAEIARGNAMKLGRMVNWMNYKGSIAEDPTLADEHNVATTADAHDVNAPVEAGREYLLLCSDVANHNVFEIYFTTGEPTAISAIKTTECKKQNIYNLAGQMVGAGYKGIVVKNGKKVMQ